MSRFYAHNRFKDKDVLFTAKVYALILFIDTKNNMKKRKHDSSKNRISQKV